MQSFAFVFQACRELQGALQALKELKLVRRRDGASPLADESRSTSTPRCYCYAKVLLLLYVSSIQKRLLLVF